ncbi:MAG: carbon-nitrogen hydrolase family protein [Vulcanimicrobiota bacterium]
MKTSPLNLIKVSVIQSRIKGYDKEHNINRHLKLIHRAVKEYYSDFVLLPNYAFQDEIEKLPGKTTAKLEKIARELEIHIIGGMKEIDERDKVFNSAFVITPAGKTQLLQRKIHIPYAEKKIIKAALEIKAYETPLAKTGCVIGNDIFYPEVARCLALVDVEIIFFPSFMVGNNGITAMESLARARAIENQVFVVNANGIPYETARVNPDIEVGKSGIYSPFLNKVDMIRGSTGEEIINYSLDLNELRKIKKNIKMTSLDHHQLAHEKEFNMLATRRPEVYSYITRPYKKTRKKIYNLEGLLKP